jgi:hypothetical protein
MYDESNSTHTQAHNDNVFTARVLFATCARVCALLLGSLTHALLFYASRLLYIHTSTADRQTQARQTDLHIRKHPCVRRSSSSSFGRSENRLVQTPLPPKLQTTQEAREPSSSSSISNSNSNSNSTSNSSSSSRIAHHDDAVATPPGAPASF